ncbi:MAG: PA2779 family protein [Solirubrobacterales bacterium]
MAGSFRARPLVALMTASALFLSSVPSTTYAALVSTDAVVAQAAPSAERGRVDEFLARQDVQAQMRTLGVSPDEARARVATLSDEEVHRIAGRINDMPAGGDALGVIVGAVVLIFIILLITDVTGLTKVFPWTRSAR